MNKIIESKYGLLTFSLLSGLSYFILIMLLIGEINFSYLLGIFFFPVIVCGTALCLMKTINAFIENDDYPRVKKIINLHIALMAFALVCLIVLVII